MSNPTCNAATLVEAFPCLDASVLSVKQQKAIRIWFNILELNSLGGTDYRSVLTSTLITDAVAFGKRMNLSERMLADLAIQRNNAVAAGATVDSSTSALLDQVKCMINYDDLDIIQLMLLCKLGVHKAYPQ